MKRTDYLLLLLIFGVTLILFYPTFTTYFTGDDFFHFKISLTDGSFTGFLKLFGLHPVSSGGYAFYRPLFREVAYNLSYRLWGLSELPLRLFAMLLHLANIYLVYLLFKRLAKKTLIAFFTALFFGLCSANVGVLYYLAGGLQVQGATLFMLLTLVFFEKHPKLSFLTFVLAAFSIELAYTLPIILVGYLWFAGKKSKILSLWPYFVWVIIIGFLNFKVIGLSHEAQYQLALSPKTILNSTAWYGLWSLGLPDTLIDYIGPGLHLSPNLMRFWGGYYRIIFPAFGVSILTFALAIRPKLKDSKLLSLVFWFVVGLSPILFLPAHKELYYLGPVLPAFWGLVFYLLFRPGYNRFLVVVFILSALVLNLASIKLETVTYWVVERGRLSGKIITEMKTQYPDLPKGAVVYIRNDPNYPFIAKEWGGTSKQASLILSNSDAFQLLYNDPTLKVYFEDLDRPPKDIPEAKLYDFMVKL